MVSIQEMTTGHYDEVFALWQTVEGVGLSEADSVDGLARFLQRNPGLSFVALDGARLVGAILCGHDGRRGYIHHLAVRLSHRRQGIGQALVERCLSTLKQTGIGKCHLFVIEENRAGTAFWRETGWMWRGELAMFSRYI